MTLALILAVGCGTPGESREDPPPPVEAVATALDASGCRLADPVDLISMAERPRRLALSLGRDGGWLFVEVIGGALRAIRLDAPHGGRSAPRSLEGAPASSLRFALPLGAGHLAVTEGECVIENASRRCLHALALPARHGGRAITRTIPLPGPVRTLRRRREGGALWIARSHAHGPPAVDVFSLEAGHILHRGFPLATEEQVGERSSEILGLAVEGERWAALWRHGGIEDPEGELLLSTEGGSRAFEPLHHALLIDSFDFTSEGLAAIATFEFARAHLYRFDLEARPLGPPDLVPPGGPIPAPFAGRVRVSLADDGERLWLSRADGAGDRMGEKVEIARRTGAAGMPADVARIADEDYAVVFVTSSAEGWQVTRRDLFCAATGAQ